MSRAEVCRMLERLARTRDALLSGSPTLKEQLAASNIHLEVLRLTKSIEENSEDASHDSLE